MEFYKKRRQDERDNRFAPKLAIWTFYGAKWSSVCTATDASACLETVCFQYQE